MYLPLLTIFLRAPDEGFYNVFNFTDLISIQRRAISQLQAVGGTYLRSNMVGEGVNRLIGVPIGILSNLVHAMRTKKMWMAQDAAIH